MNTLVRRILLAAMALTPALPALAQTYNGVTVQPQPKSSVNASVSITAGNTFQQALAANTTGSRQQLVIENNNTNTDKCWFYLGSGTPSTATSAMLLPGGSMTFAGPVMPNDALQVTCATTGDTLWINWN